MGRKIKNDPKIIELYNSGLSSRQVAEKLNLSSSRVAVVVKRLGLSRDKKTAAILRQPPKSVHERTCRQMARTIWKRVNGEIPENHHIHHIDGDFTNNNLSNLICLSARDHLILHKAGPEYTIPKHKRCQRKVYMKDYMKRYRASKT